MCERRISYSFLHLRQNDAGDRMQRLGSESSDDPADLEMQDQRPRTLRECPADLDLPPGSRQSVGAILQELSSLRSRAIERAIREAGLRQPQWRVLAEVARSNGAFQRRLATQLAIGKVRLGAILGTLERDGLVSRKSEHSDRRIRRACRPADKRPAGLAPVPSVPCRCEGK